MVDHPSIHGVHFQSPSSSSDELKVRYIKTGNHAVHQFDSRTHHSEYKVPLMRSIAHHQRITSQHQSEKPIAKHTIYGIPTQDEINLLPVFQNDKFLSPIVRHTNTPTHSNSAPTAQTIESIFDTSFQNKPTGRGDSHFS